MKNELPSLPYGYGALEPYIDARTMEIHHTKHHATYVDKLNTLFEKCECERCAAMSLEDIISDISILPDSVRQGVRNNGGGHLNHTLFWETLGPAKGGEPCGPLRDAIFAGFTDFSHFKDHFTRTALDRFGSGWVWLGLAGQGEKTKLVVLSTPNQDSPLMQGFTPILGLDLWEHAYYLKYQNRRIDYITAWWNVVNWETVGTLFVQRRETLVHAK